MNPSGILLGEINLISEDPKLILKNPESISE